MSNILRNFHFIHLAQFLRFLYINTESHLRKSLIFAQVEQLLGPTTYHPPHMIGVVLRNFQIIQGKLLIKNTLITHVLYIYIEKRCKNTLGVTLVMLPSIPQSESYIKHSEWILNRR